MGPVIKKGRTTYDHRDCPRRRLTQPPLPSNTFVAAEDPRRCANGSARVVKRFSAPALTAHLPAVDARDDKGQARDPRRLGDLLRGGAVHLKSAPGGSRHSRQLAPLAISWRGLLFLAPGRGDASALPGALSFNWHGHIKFCLGSVRPLNAKGDLWHLSELGH
jgi:hypothetical protein